MASDQPVGRNGATRSALAQISLVVLANRPRMLREMLRQAIQYAPDLAVLTEVEDLVQKAKTVKWEGVHWLVVTLPRLGRIPHQARLLQRRYPGLSVLAVSTDGSQIKARVPVEGMVQSYRTFVLTNVTLLQLLAVLRRRSADPRPENRTDM
jgi:hypothetical protein